MGFKSRYIGSLVSDFHRNPIKGGIYLYPSTKSHPHGKLRLCYECAPLAFLALEAGGAAEDDHGAILEKLPENLHQRSPFYVGSVHLIQGLRSCWMEIE